ncbi:copper resistance CopC family protein [Actinophytocola sp.]|uniref:copper resistance CopC family protein n=1 Tax=Actinophytocola sp. TaxID=1872138 RepID=UPI002ED8D5B7
MLVRHLAAALTLGALALVVTATPAFAHAELVSSTPANGSTIPAAPPTVQLVFDQPVTLAANPVEIIGPGNVTWQVATPTVTGSAVLADVRAAGPAGVYTLVYRLRSTDGHAISGSIRFTMAVAVPAAPAATTTRTPSGTTPPSGPAPESSAAAAETTTEPPPPTAAATATAATAAEGGAPWWVWALGGAILVAAITLVTLRVRRSSR